MTAIDVGDIKLLRATTNAGMLDCRKALAEAEGDVAVAESLLKEWGLAGVEKRLDRATNEGRIFIHESGPKAAMAEITCETDFVVRNELFVAAGEKIAEIACGKGLSSPDSEIEALIASLASVIKENISLGRFAFMEAAPGERIATYVHGDGRLGALVLARAEAGDEAFLHDLALHVAAFKPLFVDEAAVPEAYKRERLEDFAKEIEEDEKLRGKPAKVLEGIVAGKLRKHLAEATFLGHRFVRDETITVAEAIAKLGAETGRSLAILAFACFKIGE
jgi:elongation factor Ts